MKLAIPLRIAGIVAAVAVVAFLVVEERAWREERARLRDEIAAAQKQVQEATARQQERDAQLADALRQIARRKEAVRTPEQVVRELPHDLPLPEPIRLVPAPPEPGKPDGKPGAPSQPVAILPAEDLKPLFDFVQDCKACQTERDALRKNLADEQAKGASMTRERDAAVKLARGGGFWRRSARAAKWFGLGALAGGAAAAALRH